MKKIIKKNDICRLCETEIIIDKVRDHCHLTCNYKRRAHKICNINVTQKQSNFLPNAFNNLSIYYCHLLLKSYLIEKMK